MINKEALNRLNKIKAIDNEIDKEEEKLRRSVPSNHYHMSTIKKVLKEHYLALTEYYGGYKGGRYAPRQKYFVVDGNQEVLTPKPMNYYELGLMLDELGWYPHKNLI